MFFLFIWRWTELGHLRRRELFTTCRRWPACLRSAAIVYAAHYNSCKLPSFHLLILIFSFPLCTWPIIVPCEIYCCTTNQFFRVFSHQLVERWKLKMLAKVLESLRHSKLKFAYLSLPAGQSSGIKWSDGWIFENCSKIVDFLLVQVNWLFIRIKWSKLSDIITCIYVVLHVVEQSQ